MVGLAALDAGEPQVSSFIPQRSSLDPQPSALRGRHHHRVRLLHRVVIGLNRVLLECVRVSGTMTVYGKLTVRVTSPSCACAARHCSTLSSGEPA